MSRRKNAVISMGRSAPFGACDAVSPGRDMGGFRFLRCRLVDSSTVSAASARTTRRLRSAVCAEAAETVAYPVDGLWQRPTFVTTGVFDSESSM